MKIKKNNFAVRVSFGQENRVPAEVNVFIFVSRFILGLILTGSKKVLVSTGILIGATIALALTPIWFMFGYKPTLDGGHDQSLFKPIDCLENIPLTQWRFTPFWASVIFLLIFTIVHVYSIIYRGGDIGLYPYTDRRPWFTVLAVGMITPFVYTKMMLKVFQFEQSKQYKDLVKKLRAWERRAGFIVEIQ